MRHCFHYLLLAVLAVAGELPASSAIIMGDNCNRGVAVIGEFFENPCRGKENDPFHRIRSEGPFGEGPLTVEKVWDYLIKYCNWSMPQLGRCFAESVSGCEETEQQYLNRLVQSTSQICQANSTNISPWLDFVLTQLTDEDVANNDSCGDRGDWIIHHYCREMADNASGLADYDPDDLQSATVQELIPVVQGYWSTRLECAVERYRIDPNHCSNWRFKVLDSALTLMGPPPLGLHLNYYTEAQIREMFGFPDIRRDINPFPFMP